jgi:5-methyltetrahydropteroyltriglutamate--homocysteine methyltransferase
VKSTENRILTTHVGSLVRPKDFRELLRRRLDGEVADDAYLTALHDAVGRVVHQQAETGIDIVSDGEYGKGIGWEQYVIERLAGFGPREPFESLGGSDAVSFGDMKRFPDFYQEYWGHQNLMEGVFPCVGAIRYTGQEALRRDIANLRTGMANADVVDGFLPVVAPASAVAISPNRHYKTEVEYIFAVADALREEYRAIVDAGLIAQIDDAHIPFAYDRMVPPGTVQDYLKWAELRIDALNHALQGIPEERTRYHICWGSWNGPHTSDVPLRLIIDLVLKVRVGGYLIEAANPRHEHEWRVWEEVKLPDGKKLIPGVIAHTTNVVEHPELVAQRLVRFARLVGRDNVIGGTDCGFAQSPFARRVHPSIMWAKLKSLAEGARIATRMLWGKRAAA